VLTPYFAATARVSTVRQLGQDFFTDMKWIGHDICVSFLGKQAQAVRCKMLLNSG
jgi:hypothetical protein